MEDMSETPRLVLEKRPDIELVTEIEDSPNLILQEYKSGMFSDVTVEAFGKTWKLHKIILLQSPFFDRLLTPTRSYISLITCQDPQLNAKGVDLAFNDMYEFCQRDKWRSHRINTRNVVHVLIAACFFELRDLIRYCRMFILNSMANRQGIIKLSSDLNLMKEYSIEGPGPYGNDHKFRKLLDNNFRILDATCLASLCFSLSKYYVANDLYFDNALDQGSELDEFKYATPESFLSQLSIAWIQRVVSSDALCVPNEFERYELIKRTRDLKQQRVLVDVDVSSDVSDDFPTTNEVVQFEGSNQLKNDFTEAILSPSKKGYFASFLDGVLSRKKRKLSEDDNALDLEQRSSLGISRSIRKLKNVKATPKIEESEAIWTEIFEKGVVYTFMTFKQLDSIKREGIVDSNLVLSSHWLQSELTSGDEPQALYPLRFSCLFQKIRANFKNSNVMYSEPVVCAGTQYRVLLQLEASSLKALLQRSKHRDTYFISYEIFCVDHRQELDPDQLPTLLVPVTKCGIDGEGYAYGIDLNPSIKQEEGSYLDELCLTAVVHLVRKKEDITKD